MRTACACQAADARDRRYSLQDGAVPSLEENDPQSGMFVTNT